MAKNGTSKDFTPVQLKALDLWFTDLTTADIAKICQVGKRTVDRWIASDEWRDEVRRRTAPAKQRATSILLSAATDAANTLALKAKSMDVGAAIAVLKAVQVYVERQERVNPDVVQQFINEFRDIVESQIDEHADADTGHRIKQGINAWLEARGATAG